MLQIGACKWRVPAATSLPTSYKTVSYNIVILLLDLISWILHSYCTVAQPALMCDLARMLLKCRYQKATPKMSHNCHSGVLPFNPLKPELNPICYLLALLAHHFLHVSRIRVKSLTIRLLMSYIYIWSTYSWCF